MNVAITTFNIGILGYIAGAYGLRQSHSIKTDFGENYHFLVDKIWLSGFLSGFLSMCAYLFIKEPIHYALTVPILVLFSCQFIIDATYHELADEWNGLLFMLSILNLFIFKPEELSFHLLAFGFLTLFFFLLWLFTDGLGFGDVKFVAGTSLLLTFGNSLTFLIVSLGLASFYGIIRLILTNSIFKKKGWKEEFAFGPFLIIGMTALILF